MDNIRIFLIFIFSFLLICIGCNEEKTSNDSTMGIKDEMIKSDSIVIKDVENWNHPIAKILKDNYIKANSIEFLKDNSGIIIFVDYFYNEEINSQNAETIYKILEKIAEANSFKNFKIVCENGDQIIEVECSTQKIAKVILNGKPGLLNEMIQYHNAMMEKSDDVLNFLDRAVPEVGLFGKMISSLSNGKTSKVYMIEESPDKYSDNEFNEYYRIYVGENHPDHFVRWNTFNVHKDLKKILVLDIEGEFITLEKWRKLNAKRNYFQDK